LLTGRADKCANVDGEERLLLDGREPVHRARACEQRRKLLRRSTTGGVHVGSAAFGDKCESSKLGVVGSAWHRPASTYAAADGAGAIHRLTAPEDTGPLPRPLFTWTTAASKHVPRPPPILWRTAAGQGGCRRAGKCARSQSRSWLDVRLRHQGQAQCGDGTCTEDSPQECPRITEPAAATQRVGRQCRGGVWLVRGLPHNVRQMLLGDDSDTLR
jgi:hypothetical protein